MRIDIDARCDPDKHVLRATNLSAQRSEPFRIVTTIKDDESRIGIDRGLEISLTLSVAVHNELAS